MGLVDLYRQTRGEKIIDRLKLAADLIDSRDLIKDGTDDNQDRDSLPRPETGPSATPCAPTISSRGSPTSIPRTATRASFLRSSRSGKMWAHTKTYITWRDRGPSTTASRPTGTRTTGRFSASTRLMAANISLPNATAYNETCANIGNALWNWRMFQDHGRGPLHGHGGNRPLQQRALPGSVLDGHEVLLPERAPPAEGRCPSRCAGRAPGAATSRASAVRPTSSGPSPARGPWAYGLTRDGLTVNLYGGNRLSTRLADGKRRGAHPGHGLSLGRHDPHPDRRSAGPRLPDLAQDTLVGAGRHRGSEWRGRRHNRCRCRPGCP